MTKKQKKMVISFKDKKKKRSFEKTSCCKEKE